MENITDTYQEHEQHIKGEGGKYVPFWRNMKTCSTCYSEHQKFLKKNDSKVLAGRGWNYDYEDYKIV